MCEMKISQALSLRSKFLFHDAAETVKSEASPQDKAEVVRHMGEFVRDLYTKSEVKVIGASRGPAGQLITNMFKDAQKAKGVKVGNLFPFTYSQEYILRTMLKRPYGYSRSAPQRLYCCIKDGEFRMAGAFTLSKDIM